MSTFEIVRGVEGHCLVLDGTRICGPKPWGGGRIVRTFRTDGIYEAISKKELERLKAENAELRRLAGDAIRALENIHCNNHDMPYCNEECPYSTGPDTCAATELMVRAEEMRAGFYGFNEEGRET